MKLFLINLVLSLHFCFVYLWPFMEHSNHSLSHSGHCYSTTFGVGAMEKGEYKTLGHICIMAMCDDDEKGTIYYHRCYEKKLPSKCRFLSPELPKPYPDCCPYVDCYWQWRSDKGGQEIYRKNKTPEKCTKFFFNVFTRCTNH